MSNDREIGELDLVRLMNGEDTVVTVEQIGVIEVQSYSLARRPPYESHSPRGGGSGKRTAPVDEGAARASQISLRNSSRLIDCLIAGDATR